MTANHIAAIHVLKAKLRLTDEDYRALLKHLTGKGSSKDCMAAQWEDVDQFCLNRLSELVDELEQAAVDITPDDAPVARDPYGTGGE